MAMMHDFSVIKIGEIGWDEIKISVHDSFIQPNLKRFLNVDAFWGARDKNPSKGLDYCGYTYIPPRSLDAFLEAVKGVAGLKELEKLALLAKMEKAWIEHHGL